VPPPPLLLLSLPAAPSALAPTAPLSLPVAPAAPATTASDEDVRMKAAALSLTWWATAVA
jgi:hypothetical protein